MDRELLKRRFAEIGLGLIIILGAFFVFAALFGFTDALLGGQQKGPSQEEIEQEALRASIVSQGGEIVEVEPITVPDPDPVPEAERTYPAARIFRLSNLTPITLEEAQRDLRLKQELRKQQEEMLAALDIENNEPDGAYFLQDLEHLGSVNAESFLVGDLDTGEVIFERKAHDQYPIASVSKYFTAYTAATTLEPNEVATIDDSELAVEGNRGGFISGDKMTIRELLYPLLLVSSNDAAEVIANQRNRPEFIAAMNQVAIDEHLEKTAFQDPTGLSKGNVSSARDLFQFMRRVKEDFPQIVGISSLSTKTIDNYTWYNINKAITFPEFRGGKTGFTNAARQTSIGYYEIVLTNGMTKNIGVVILQSNTRQQDTRNLLDYLKNYVVYETKGS